MGLSSWPSITDDSGTKTDGTIINKTLFDSIKASIEAAVFSLTNPSISAANIIDEVKNARGSLTTLDARLDVALNEDGTPKSVAGQATNTDLQAQIGSRNVALNGDLDDWGNGAAAAPDSFTLTGAGATIARTGAGEADTFTFGAGKYAAKLTRVGTDLKLTQSVIAVADMAAAAEYKGKKVAVLIKGKTSIASHLRVVVDDGIGTTASSFHTGDGVSANLTVLHTISNSATKLDVYAEVLTSNGAAYFGGLTIIFSNLTPTSWKPLSTIDLTKLGKSPTYKPGGVATRDATVSGRVNSTYADVGNFGGGEDILMTYSLPANTLDVDGKAVRVTAFGTYANNANAKSVTIYFGATNALNVGLTVSQAGNWRIEALVIRTGAATQRAIMILYSSSNVGVGPVHAVAYVTPAETLSGAVTIKVTGTGVADNDLIQKGMIVEVVG